LVSAADRALQAAGFTVRHIQESHGFARLIIESGELSQYSQSDEDALAERHLRVLVIQARPTRRIRKTQTTASTEKTTATTTQPKIVAW
jgi:hypothetical protein